MAATLSQMEDVPSSWPDTPEGLSTAAAALDEGVVWGRIERYVGARWTARSVVWLVEGPGDWWLPLEPAEVTAAEGWTGTEWEEDDLPAGPYGYCVPCEGPWRVSATVGGGTVPALASEAYRRLAEYMVATPSAPGARSETVTAGTVSISRTRSPAWAAQAIVNSGAADLLRPYRRVA